MRSCYFSSHTYGQSTSPTFGDSRITLRGTDGRQLYCFRPTRHSKEPTVGSLALLELQGSVL